MKRAAFVGLAGTACAAPDTVRAQSVPIIRVGTVPSEPFALPTYAKESGFFSRHGIDAQVKYVGTNSGGLTAALIGGELDVAASSMGPISNAYLRGIPLRLVAPGAIITSEAPTTGIVVLKNSPIVSGHDLNGKTAATSALRDVIHVALLKWIDVNGGDSSAVKFVELPMSEGPIALAGGRIDACSLTEPRLTDTKDQLRPLGYIYDVISHRTMITMHIALPDWLDKNADTARRFVLAMRDAARWANTNKTAAGAIVARETKISLDVMKRMNHVVYGETLDVTTIQPQIDVLAEYKFIDRRYDVASLLWAGPH